MRKEASFRTFFEKVRELAQKLEINGPKLPRKRKTSSHYEEGEVSIQFVSTVEERYRQVFYQAIDMVVNCICDKFQQKDFTETLQTIEILLLKALREENIGHELQ